MKVSTLFTLSTLFIAGAAKAQSPVFSKTAQQYNRLTGATQVMKDSVWDDPGDWKPAERNIPLGFNFQAFNRSISTFTWADAAIEFRDGDTVIKIGMEADFCDYGFGTNNALSKLYRKTDGTAPNRIVKIEFRKAGFWDEWALDGSCKDSADLQIWIYENLAKVELRFGPRSVANFSNIFPSKLGVTCARYDGSGGSAGLILDGDPINPVTYSFGDTGTRGLTGWPVANQVYIFDFGIASVKPVSTAMPRIWTSGNTIFAPDFNGTVLELRGMDGRLLSSGKVEEGVLNTGKNLPAGIYILGSADGSIPARKICLN